MVKQNWKQRHPQSLAGVGEKGSHHVWGYDMRWQVQCRPSEHQQRAEDTRKGASGKDQWAGKQARRCKWWVCWVLTLPGALETEREGQKLLLCTSAFTALWVDVLSLEESKACLGVSEPHRLEWWGVREGGFNHNHYFLHPLLILWSPEPICIREVKL